jgi:hypothetical protein
MGVYITQTDLENALSARTIQAIYQDDPDSPTINAVAVEAVIDRAEAMVDSALLGFQIMPLVNPADRLAKAAALEFAIAFSFERHPEYVRSFGEEARKERWERAQNLLDRIQTGLRRLPDNNATATVGAGSKQKNVGGIVTDGSRRVVISSADGTWNGGDF